MGWSNTAWTAAEPVFGKIISHPFLLGLASGELPREKFVFYIGQDALYLKDYVRVMAVIASRFEDPRHTGLFLEYAMENLDAEKELHSLYLPGTVTDSALTASPVCTLCASHLWKQAVSAPLEVALASVLPCFSVYAMAGRHVFENSRIDGNPYRDWITVYGSDGFDAPARQLADLCDYFAERTVPRTRQEMTEAFVTGVRLEWMFWDSAYNMESWKI